MKNLKKLVFGLLAMLVMVTSVNAACENEQNSNKYKITVDKTEKYCATLKDAFAEVTDNGTITLLESVENTGNENMLSSSIKNFTIDLNNHTLTFKNSAAGIIINSSKATLTIKDSGSEGKIVNEGGSAIYGALGNVVLNGGTIQTKSVYSAIQLGQNSVNSGTGNITSTQGNLEMNGGVIENINPVASGFALNIVNGKATINGGTITATTSNTIAVGNYTSVNVSSLSKDVITTGPGTLEVNNGVIENKSTVDHSKAIIVVAGKTTVNNGTITSSAKGSTIQVGQPKGPDEVELSVKNGKITNTSKESGLAIISARGTTTIAGGELTNESASATVQVGNSKDYAAKLNVTGGTIESKSKTNSTALIVPYGKCEATINGGTIKVNEEAKNSIAVIVGYNPVEDLSLAGEGAKVIINKGDITGGIALFGKKPQLDITGGNITSKSFAVSGNGSPEGSVNATLESVINISGDAKLTSTGTTAIYHPQNGTLNITGGNITGKLGIVARAGDINIKNANITANGASNETYRVGDAKDGENYVQLPGGAGVIVDNSEEAYPGEAKVKIESGNFDTKGLSVLAYKDETNAKKDIIINGGTFNQEVDKVYLAEGLDRSVNGVVGKVYEITTEDENGKLTVPANAAVGETVKVTYEAAEGYKLSRILLNGTVLPANEDGTYTFIMSASNVTLKAEFEKVNTEDDGESTTEVVVEKTEGSKEVTLSENTNDVLKESLKNTKDKELQEFLANNDVTVHLESNKVAKENVAAEVVEKFESVVKGATVAEYFDLDILVTAEGVDEVHYLKELSKPITLTVDLPKLPEVAKGYTRTYYILREHDGVVEKLNATLTKDGKLSFATDKFSKYAIAYVDEEVKNPSTLDSIVSIVTLAISSIGTAGYSIKKFIRK